MRHILTLALIFMLAVAAGGVAILLNSEQGQSSMSTVHYPALRPGDRVSATWTARHIRLPKAYASLPQRFDLAFDVTIPQPAAQKGRILFNYRDIDNYYYAELTGAGTRLGRVEGGMDFVMGGSDRGVVAGRTHRVKIKRRDLSIAVLIDGELAALAYDGTFYGGRAGMANLDRTVELFRPAGRVQGIEQELNLADDFMRAPGEPGPWQVVQGSWKTVSLKNPSMSANAFTYKGGGRDAMAVTGYGFWDRYTIHASARGPARGAMGLVFAYRDKQNYWLFRWEARKVPNEPSGVRQIVRVKGGARTVVAEGPGGYIPDQWYRLHVRLGMGECSVSVDGHELLAAGAADLTEGMTGLYAHTHLNVLFDDVLVSGVRSYFDGFDDAFALNRWQNRGGRWRLVDDGEPGQRHLQADLAGGTAGRLVFGLPSWGNYRFGADVIRGPGEAGLVFNYLDEWNYHLFVVNFEKDEGRLIRVDDGKASTLDSASLKLARRAHLSIRTDRGHVAAYVDGRRSLEGWDGNLSRGRVGLHARGTGAIGFDNASVRFEERLDPVLSANAIFQYENSMTAWAGNTSDWDASGKLQGATVRWHRAQFPGDTQLSVEVGRERGPKSEIALSVAKSGKANASGARGKRPSNGYVLHVALDREKGSAGREPSDRDHGALSLTLKRAGATVQSREFPAPEKLHSAGLRHAGKYVVGFVNGAQEILFRDENPLVDTKVAYYARGLEGAQPRSPLDARIYNRHLQNYTFSRAPTDWRVGAGFWEVTNRWQCDPRWSFFSGRSYAKRNDGRDRQQPAVLWLRPAVLWNKRLFQGDVTVEFYAGPMMNNSLGKAYSYARDLNVSICADGQDLSSGYTCTFGGNDNKHSLILRGDEVVATSSTGRIPRSMHIHRQWFYIRAEKRGNVIHFRVHRDTTLLFSMSYEDREPLTGKQIALWTYGGGMIVSRVRISGEGETFESPDRIFLPAIRTFYSK